MTAGRIPAIALLVLIVASGAAGLFSIGRASAGMDFYQMKIGARMARETRDFYAAETRVRMGEHYLREALASKLPREIAVARFRRNLEVLSTPLLYTLYTPMRGSYERDLLIFQITVFVALLTWVTIFARLSGHGLLAALLILAVLVVAFEPTRSDARVVNMNHIILLLLAVAAWLTAKRRFGLAGAVLVVAILTKPYVIVTLPLTWMFWVAARRWRDLAQHAAGAAIAGSAALVISSLYFRSATIWIEWLAAFRAMPEEMVALDRGNIALALLVRLLTGVDLSIAILGFAFLTASAVAFRVRPDHRTDVPLIGMACVLFQLGSPLVWVHHLLLSVPLIIYLLRPGQGERAKQRQLAGAVALALVAVEPLAVVVPDMIQVAAFVNVGLLLAFVVGLRDFADLRESDAVPASLSVT